MRRNRRGHYSPPVESIYSNAPDGLAMHVRCLGRKEMPALQKASHPQTSAKRSSPSQRTLRGLDWLNFLPADVQTGVGPFLAIYLAGYTQSAKE